MGLYSNLSPSSSLLSLPFSSYRIHKIFLNHEVEVTELSKTFSRYLWYQLETPLFSGYNIHKLGWSKLRSGYSKQSKSSVGNSFSKETTWETGTIVEGCSNKINRRWNNMEQNWVQLIAADLHNTHNFSCGPLVKLIAHPWSEQIRKTNSLWSWGFYLVGL